MSLRARFPLTVTVFVVLGVAAMTFGVFLMFKSCASSDCINTTIGGVFAVWGFLAFLSLVPNMVGLVCVLTSVAFSIFLGLVFTFARQPAGLLPPIVLSILAFAEKDLIRAYYARAAAADPVELP